VGHGGQPHYFFAFNFAFGGLAQFLAGLWSFRARDHIASSLLTMGSACVCGGFWTGSTLWQDIAAWLFIVGACTAWYVGAMTMLHDSWKRVILPLGAFRKSANIPGFRSLQVAEYVYGQPGVRHGQ
jgi:succinate-acetate transporter protein